MAPFSDLDLMFLTAKAPTAARGARRRSGASSPVGPEAQGRPFGPLDAAADRARQEGHDASAPPSSRRAGCGATKRRSTRRCTRFRKEVVAGTAAEFVTAKLAERDERHVRMGDSRYVVEPNVKDGKGGLRDLHTLYWIGKYVHGVERPADLVGAGLLTAAEFRRFDRAERFFWSVRCHLHLLAGRRRGTAELRISAAHRRDHELRRAPREIGGRALHAILLPQREDGRRFDRPVPGAARRATRQEGLSLRPADDPPPAQAAWPASSSTAAESRSRPTISSAPIRCACSNCSRSRHASSWRSTPPRCAPPRAMRR